ncbi:MAG TPA: FAD-dependent oxidoreductase [Candidatus Nanoarchaeia archaeon]|nr:FAD-dependent oxidoreductase [Candidatus Nanoarchaeia archaeon]
MAKEMYDVVIVGGGVAGYGAAVYAARFRLKTLIIAKEVGGLIALTHVVENYPGYSSLSGLELANKLKEHAEYFEVNTVEDEVTGIKKNKDHFSLKSSSGKEYGSKTVFLATGTKRRELNVPGEKEFYGKGVSYCATCDAAFFRDKIIGIVGGSDSAAKEALLLSEYGKHVYIIYRGENIRAEPINLESLRKKKNITIINKTNVVEIKGEKKLTQVIFDKPYNGSKEFKLDGLFIEIGHLPQNELAKQLGVKLNEGGEILIDSNSRTNVPGVYAMGDVTQTPWKQAITAVAEGVIAAFSAYEDISKGKVSYHTEA